MFRSILPPAFFKPNFCPVIKITYIAPLIFTPLAYLFFKNINGLSFRVSPLSLSNSYMIKTITIIKIGIHISSIIGIPHNSSSSKLRRFNGYGPSCVPFPLQYHH